VVSSGGLLWCNSRQRPLCVDVQDRSRPHLQVSSRSVSSRRSPERSGSVGERGTFVREDRRNNANAQTLLATPAAAQANGAPGNRRDEPTRSTVPLHAASRISAKCFCHLLCSKRERSCPGLERAGRDRAPSEKYRANFAIQTSKLREGGKYAKFYAYV